MIINLSIVALIIQLFKVIECRSMRIDIVSKCYSILFDAGVGVYNTFYKAISFLSIYIRKIYLIVIN